MMNINLPPQHNLPQSAPYSGITDRRHAPYPFGTLAWLVNIQNHLLNGPKAERRTDNSRQEQKRKFAQYPGPLSGPSRSEAKHSPALLNSEERKMIQNLYLNTISHP